MQRRLRNIGKLYDAAEVRRPEMTSKETGIAASSPGRRRANANLIKTLLCGRQRSVHCEMIPSPSKFAKKIDVGDGPKNDAFGAQLS